jgi:ABC-2 type transport system permease protein
MHKIWAVVRREFLERVRTRAFIVGTIGGPLLLGFFMVLPAILAGRDTRARHVVVMDAASGGFGDMVATALRDEVRDTTAEAPEPVYRVEYLRAGRDHEALRDSLVRLTGLDPEDDARAIDGILVVTDTALTTGELTYVGTNVGSPGDMGRLERVLRPVVLRERLARADVDPAVAFAAVRPVTLETQRVTKGVLTGESGEASFLLAYLMAFVLYIALLLYGLQIMMSVVEEKSSRIMEILLSSLSPFQLLLGKIIGVGAVGLLQLGIWAGTAMLLTTYRIQLAGVLGVPAAEMRDIPIPTISPALLIIFLLFFVLGFMLYAAAYAAVGAMCNSQQETQQVQMPVTLFVGLGLVSMFALLGDPNGDMAQLMSFIPPIAPFVTPVRYSLSPLPFVTIVASALATVAGILAVAWVAGRIYRVGILSYGKRPTMGELLRWVRAS